jgi:hypothetical protein
MPHHPEDGEHPRVVLVAAQKHSGRSARRGADVDQHFLQRARGDSQQLAYVVRVHDDVVLDRSAIPEAVQQSRRVRTAAHRVHHDIGRQLTFGTPVAVDHPHSGDAPTIRCRRQLDHLMAAENRHVAHCPKAPPHTAFQKRSARHVNRQRFRLLGDPSRADNLVAAERQKKLGQLSLTPHGRTVGDQIIEKPGKELVQDLRAAGQQNMNVPTLWHPASDSGIVR